MRVEDRVEYLLAMEPPHSLDECLRACATRGFTGTLMVHFLNGRPRYVDLGRILRIEFDG